MSTPPPSPRATYDLSGLQEAIANAESDNEEEPGFTQPNMAKTTEELEAEHRKGGFKLSEELKEAYIPRTTNPLITFIVHVNGQIHQTVEFIKVRNFLRHYSKNPLRVEGCEDTANEHLVVTDITPDSNFDSIFTSLGLSDYFILRKKADDPYLSDPEKMTAYPRGFLKVYVDLAKSDNTLDLFPEVSPDSLNRALLDFIDSHKAVPKDKLVTELAQAKSVHGPFEITYNLRQLVEHSH